MKMEMKSAVRDWRKGLKRLCVYFGHGDKVGHVRATRGGRAPVDLDIALLLEQNVLKNLLLAHLLLHPATTTTKKRRKKKKREKKRKKEKKEKKRVE